MIVVGSKIVQQIIPSCVRRQSTSEILNRVYKQLMKIDFESE